LSVKVEALRQGQADGARQRQLVFLERILGHDQLLLQALVIDRARSSSSFGAVPAS
jgi:hypothetical protein